MRPFFLEAEKHRQPEAFGGFGPSATGNLFGVFRYRQGTRIVSMIVSDGDPNGEDLGWEHASVSVRQQGVDGFFDVMPTWDDMCRVKDLFWTPEECVIQFHPPASNYVNTKKNCLHLWKNYKAQFPMPPTIMV